MTATFPESQTIDQAPIARPGSSWVELWRRLRANKSAMVGLASFSILLFCALFANFIAPYSPFDTSAFLNGQAPGAS